MRKLITVQNMARYDVTRANLRFPPKRVVSFVIDDSTSKFKEIKACGALKILKLEDFSEAEAVLKVDEAVSKVVPPVVVPKVEEPETFLVVEASKAEVKEIKSFVIEEVAPPVVEPVLDTTSVTIAPDEPIPDVAELEVVVEAEDVIEDAEVEEIEEEVVNKVISCPYCDFEAMSQMGVYHHVRTKHSEHYEEYKERVKKS